MKFPMNFTKTETESVCRVASNDFAPIPATEHCIPSERKIIMNCNCTDETFFLLPILFAIYFFQLTFVRHC